MNAERRSFYDFGILLKYALSGGMAAIVYIAVVFTLTQSSFDVVLSGVLGYVVATPCAYLMHRRFSFGSKREIRPEATRFLIISIVGAFFSGILPKAFMATGMPLLFSLLFTSVIVPSMNYILHSSWVFGRNEKN